MRICVYAIKGVNMQFVFNNTHITVENIEKVTKLIYALHKDIQSICPESHKCEKCEFSNDDLPCNEQDDELFIFDADKGIIITMSENYATMLMMETGIEPTAEKKS